MDDVDHQTESAVTWFLESSEPAIRLMTRRDLLGGPPAGGSVTPEVVDWGRVGPNEMITLNALRVLRAADRL